MESELSVAGGPRVRIRFPPAKSHTNPIIHFYFIHRPGSRVRLATQVGGDITFPDGDAIIAHLKEIGAVLLIVDPFNHAHTVEDR
jgi:hypothetical protein